MFYPCSTNAMATVKFELRKKQNNDGTYPLALRITKNRRSSYIYLGKSLEEKFWDQKAQRVRKSHPNSVRLNNFLLQKLSEYNDSILQIETDVNPHTVKAIRQNLESKNGISFFDQAKEYLANLKAAGKFNRRSADEPRIKRFKEFVKEKDITFNEITVPLIEQFKVHLKSTRTITDRTVVNHLIVLRTIFSRAIKAGLVDPKFYPFGQGKVKIKFPESAKIGLSEKEIKILEELDLSDEPRLHHVRNLFLFSFYFAGMRVSDVLRLRWSDIQNDRLYYTMGKNAKAGSLKLPEKVIKILNFYQRDKKSKTDLIFPELKHVKSFDNSFDVQRKISYAVKTINKFLERLREEAKIEKSLTMHIARHTFGNISGDKIPIQMLQKLYRHSSITTTIGYQANFIHKNADEALDSVIDF